MQIDCKEAYTSIPSVPIKREIIKVLKVHLLKWFQCHVGSFSGPQYKYEIGLEKEILSVSSIQSVKVSIYLLQ